jgi:tRNA threonylcarbamoyladenosine biosynthesis protein TsaB
MNTLALEHSCGALSAAVLRDGNVLGETQHEAVRSRPGALLDTALATLRDCGLDAAAVDLFAVGLGPGTYSSLRISLSTANGLALPGDKPVRGVCSAEALAVQTAAHCGVVSVAVLGDARRERFWLARYRVVDGRVTQRTDIDLLPAGELPRNLAGQETVVSPDWDRIGALLRRVMPASNVLIEAPAAPRAATVGRLAWRRHARGDPLTPPAPLYMHPPVFVPPLRREQSAGAAPGEAAAGGGA